MIDLVQGIRGHRAYSRRSVRGYNSHISNAIHFAALRDGEMWLVEPLGWALLVARGGNPELEAKGDAHAEEQMQLYLNAGWRRITEEDEEFKELWNQLHDWLSGRKIGLSARKGVRAIFWTAPESTDD